MHAKKLLSLLLSALAAVTLLASCGSRWDYSREAVKAANEAQGETLRVEFQVDQRNSAGRVPDRPEVHQRPPQCGGGKHPAG